jgi:CRISPR-associated protein Csd2
LKFMIPYAYQHTASAIRPQISILHAWWGEHKNALGSCPEHLFTDALTPKVKEGVNKPSSKKDYIIPTIDDLGDIKDRFDSIDDLGDIKD